MHITCYKFILLKKKLYLLLLNNTRIQRSGFSWSIIVLRFIQESLSTSRTKTVDTVSIISFADSLHCHICTMLFVIYFNNQVSKISHLREQDIKLVPIFRPIKCSGYSFSGQSSFRSPGCAHGGLRFIENFMLCLSGAREIVLPGFWVSHPVCDLCLLTLEHRILTVIRLAQWKCGLESRSSGDR